MNNAVQLQSGSQVVSIHHDSQYAVGKTTSLEAFWALQDEWIDEEAVRDSPSVEILYPPSTPKDGLFQKESTSEMLEFD